MNLRELKRSSIVWSFFLLLNLGSVQAAEKPAWQQKMRGIEKVFQELLVDLNSDQRFNSPKNFKRIEENAEKLSKLAHSLRTQQSRSPDLDPSIPLIASLFAEETARAKESLKAGYRPYARKALKSMTNYCVACHTRSNTGPSFANLAPPAAPLLNSLKKLERADYFTSVRQFDRALEEYELLVQDAGYAAEHPFEWERAIRSALAINIRVKKDPDRALKIVEQTLKTAKAPYFLLDQATRWKQSLLEWKAEKPATPKTEDEYYAEATRLITAAKALQKFPTDRSADVLYLRATSALHDQLGIAPNGQHAGDALYLAGLSYEVLSDMNLNEMHEFYYLSCIHKVPHTEKSRQCYRSYEESIYFGYTGSAGTRLPAKVKSRLDELDLMSNPLEVKSSPRPTLE